MIPLLLLRPQPGNDASAARARALGLTVIQAPLFDIVAAQPAPAPDGPFDAVLLTSANGARFGTGLLAAHHETPVYAVGEATAQAARAQGCKMVVTGGGDAASTVPLIAAAGHRRVLHICGVDVRPFDPVGLTMTAVAVYRSAERDEAAVRPLLAGLGRAVAALHSPRAGRRLHSLLSAGQRAHIRIAAISQKAADSCGSGWAGVAVSSAPDDTALLACAEALCICDE